MRCVQLEVHLHLPIDLLLPPFCFVHAESISSGSIDSAPSIAASVAAFKWSFSQTFDQASAKTFLVVRLGIPQNRSLTR